MALIRIRYNAAKLSPGSFRCRIRSVTGRGEVAGASAQLTTAAEPSGAIGNQIPAAPSRLPGETCCPSARESALYCAPVSSRPARLTDTIWRRRRAPGAPLLLVFCAKWGCLFILLNAVVWLPISSARWKTSTSRRLCSRSFLELAGGTWSELCSGEALGSRAVQSLC